MCVCVCVCVYQELNFLAEEESIEWPFILVMTYMFLLLLINYLPKWAYENLYRPLCNCACCCNDCSVSCYYFSLTCDSPFFFFFFFEILYAIFFTDSDSGSSSGSEPDAVKASAPVSAIKVFHNILEKFI